MIDSALAVLAGILTGVFATHEGAAQGLVPGAATPRIRTIVLDPGHGGANKGALSNTGRYEKDIVLDIAQALRQALERDLGVRVIMTRESDRDVSYRARTNLANQESADLFISIHCNASGNPQARGVEVLVLSEEALARESNDLRGRMLPANGRLAAASDMAAAAILKDLFQVSAQNRAIVFAGILQERLVALTGAPDRGVKPRAPAVLRGAEMPAVLVELGFLTHADEALLLETPEYRQVIVQAMVEAVRIFDSLQ